MKKIPLLLSLLFLFSCQGKQKQEEIHILEDDYRNYYEIFVSSFADSNNDGIGDLKGIDEKLDYLSDIGYTGIWLTPIFSSPSYHKYDTKDYFKIDSAFGSLDDLKKLVKDAHKRDMKVILDGVFNHSSETNEWFTKSLLAHRKKLLGQTLSEEEKDYDSLYTFVDKEEDKIPGRKYCKAGANDFFYECNFSTEMPEFNFESSFTYSKISSIIDYYMSEEIAVDGFRLDAVLYYDYKNTEKNIEVLNYIADKIHSHNGYVVGECYSDKDTIKEYYKSNCDSFFYFPSMGNDGFLVSSLGFSGGFKNKYLEGLKEMVEIASSHIPAPFLDNHDTPRFTRARNKRQNKFLLGLRDMANGCVFNYYGDEIGMTSTNLKNGDYQDASYRTHYYFDDETHDMECDDPERALEQENCYSGAKAQLQEEDSILNYEKKALRLRNTYPSIARGTIHVQEKDQTINDDTDDNLLLCLDKTYQDETIKMIFNFSDEKFYSYNTEGKKVLYVLKVDDKEEEMGGDILTLPPYSIALLQ